MELACWTHIRRYVGYDLRGKRVEQFCLVGYNAVNSIESQPTIRRDISPLCLAPAFILLLCSAYSSPLMMEVIRYTKISVDFNGLHDVLCQNTALFVTTAVKTSSPVQRAHCCYFVRGIWFVNKGVMWRRKKAS
jgi:hypothetical protein